MARFYKCNYDGNKSFMKLDESSTNEYGYIRQVKIVYAPLYGGDYKEDAVSLCQSFVAPKGIIGNFWEPISQEDWNREVDYLKSVVGREKKLLK